MFNYRLSFNQGCSMAHLHPFPMNPSYITLQPRRDYIYMCGRCTEQWPSHHWSSCITTHLFPSAYQKTYPGLEWFRRWLNVKTGEGYFVCRCVFQVTHPKDQLSISVGSRDRHRSATTYCLTWWSTGMSFSSRRSKLCSGSRTMVTLNWKWKLSHGHFGCLLLNQQEKKGVGWLRD